MDVAIAIRTAVVKAGQLHVQAAAGIVADSEPQSEWQETQHKARALLHAADVAASEAGESNLLVIEHYVSFTSKREHHFAGPGQEPAACRNHRASVDKEG